MKAPANLGEKSRPHNSELANATENQLAQPSKAELTISVQANSLLQSESDYQVIAEHLWLTSMYGNDFPLNCEIQSFEPAVH